MELRQGKLNPGWIDPAADAVTPDVFFYQGIDNIAVPSLLGCDIPMLYNCRRLP
jgi:hypothetical protein